MTPYRRLDAARRILDQPAPDPVPGQLAIPVTDRSSIVQQDRIAEFAMRTVTEALTGNSDGVTDALADIAADGTLDVYAVCRRFADIAAKAMTEVAGPAAPDLTRGGLWTVVEEVPGGLDDPAVAFAARFIVATANADTDTLLALYTAARTHGAAHFTECVYELIENTISLHQQAADMAACAA